MAAIVIDSKCAKCGGNITDDYGEPVCLQCGNRPLGQPRAGVVKDVTIAPVVEKRPNDPKKARVWFQKHFREVRADLLVIGNKPTCEKWGIPHQMIGHFLREHPINKTSAAPGPPAPDPRGRGPQLPAFSDSWQPEVQVKWLDTWLAASSQGGKP